MEATPTLVINYYSGFKQNVVPLFQRPYTWSEKQWRTLLVSRWFAQQKTTHGEQCRQMLTQEAGIQP
jgi:hypothetical protein